MAYQQSKYCAMFLFFMLSSSIALSAVRNTRVKNEVSQGKFQLRSSAFRFKANIPAKYTCDGKDVSPPLQWRNAPKGTKSFVLIFQDPDARGGKSWVHWVVFNIPVTMNKFYEKIKIASFGGAEGNNSWGVPKYGGPCPPVKEHRYIFTIYALNVAQLPLRVGASRDEVMRAMQGKILGNARLVGIYQRAVKKL